MMSDCDQKTTLSHDLFTDYQHYKTSTAFFVRWLLDNGDASHTGDRTLASVKQLMNLAQMVRDNNVTALSHVLQALRTSIKKRKKITDFF